MAPRVVWPYFSTSPRHRATFLLVASLVVSPSAALNDALPPILAQVPASDPIGTVAGGVPFTAAQLAALLPATVYFQGRTAPLQLRNAGGTSFSGEVVWVALVDTSGYASSVQARYQFYLVTEGPLLVGGVRLAPGAYGGGFLGDRFVLMDVGGHTVAEGATVTDATLPRPRPLQVIARSDHAVELLLGRQSVVLSAASGAAPVP